MSRSDARPFAGPPDEDGTALPDRSRRRSPIKRAGTAILAFVLSNFRLRSDGRREGQDAFTASPFSRLALTQMLSLGADAMVTVALAGSLFFNISVTAAKGRVALSLILTVAPFAVVAPLLGPIIDRAKGGRRAMIVASAVGRIAACLFMARYIHGLLLFPAAFLSLISSKAYTVAKAAIVPAVVEHNDDLVEANSKLAVGGAIAGFVASIPGVPILKLFGAATLLRVDALVYLACAISAFRLIQTPTPRLVRPDKAPDTSVTSRFNKARGNLAPGALTAAAIAMAAVRFGVGFLVFLVAFAFRRTHAPAWWYGLILAGSVGGNLVGAAIAPRLRGRVREEYIVAGSVSAVVVAGVLLMPFDVFQRRPAASILAAVIGISAGTGKLAFDSLVQQEVPAAAQGRTFGRLEAMFQLVWVLGALVPVLITLSLGDGNLIIAVVAGAALVVYVAGVRLARLNHLPQWWPGTGPRPSAPAPALGGAVGAPMAAMADPLDPAPAGVVATPYWPEPPAPVVTGLGALGGPVVGAEDSSGLATGSAGPLFPTIPADGPAEPTIANGPVTRPNLTRPPRLRPPPLPGPPPPLDGGANAEPPA